MPRILAIDYGSKRVGIATTDNEQIIATSLATVPEKEILHFIQNYARSETISCFVVGEPKRLNNMPAQSAPLVEKFILSLHQKFPDIPIIKHDERFTSKMALQSMIDAGKKKKERRIKENLDKISAVIILQSYLESIKK